MKENRKQACEDLLDLIEAKMEDVLSGITYSSSTDSDETVAHAVQMLAETRELLLAEAAAYGLLDEEDEA